MTPENSSHGGPKCHSLIDLVGNTPVLRVDTPLPVEHPGFWAKLEGLSPGSMKARAALAMITGARERGELLPGGRIIESSSGTLGVGLTYVGTALGHPVTIVTDGELDDMTLTLLRAHGARIEIVRRPHGVGGWQRARLDRVHELLAEDAGAFWPNQYDNPDNAGGYRELGRELVSQLDRLDAVVCSVGTGGHSAGIATAVRERWPDVRVIGVDAAGSTIFGAGEQSTRVMRGLGSSIHPNNVDYDVFEEVHWVGPEEAAETCDRLAEGNFVTGGWSTGAVALVAAWCSRRLESDNVAAIFPDGPHRYHQTLFDPGFRSRHGLIPQQSGPSEPAEPGGGSNRWNRSVRVTDPCPARTGTPDRCQVCGKNGHGT